MVAHPHRQGLTFGEYLAVERRAATKSELIDGVMVAMAGASYAHNLIASRITRLLDVDLENTPCAVVGSDQRLYVPGCDRVYYADVVVICGEPQFSDGIQDTLLNPTIIVEVLSDSTEKNDRTEKFDCYATLPSLHTYLLVAQDRPRIERYTRETDDMWRLRVANTLDSSLEIPSLNCTLSLAQVYARVAFPDQQREDRTT